MQGESIGVVELGEVFYFAVSNRAADGTALAFVPSYFDIVDNATGDVILSNQSIASTTDLSLWRGQIDTRSQTTDQSEPFRPNRTYSILVKSTGTEDPEAFLHFNFSILGALSVRLKRLLALGGENLVADLYTYDNGNNVTSYRVRIFDTRENAAQATPGITDVPETGEIATYTVTQNYSIGRQLRQSATHLIDGDLGDL